MESNESLHRTLHDGTETEAFGGSCLGKLFTIVPSYTSHRPDGEMGSLVGNEVVAEELAEILDDKLAQWLTVEMLANKGR